MPNIEQSLGIHEQALKLRAYRMELISSNLANADTHNYKATHIKSHEILSSYKRRCKMQRGGSAQKTRHTRHAWQTKT